MMKQVAIFLADGFEESEAIIIIDILRRANIHLDIISVTAEELVTGAHNIIVKAEKLFDNQKYEHYDMLILPGGASGVSNLISHDKLLELLLNFHQQGKYLAAICAAPQILGKIGVARNKTISVYPGCSKYLKNAKISQQPVSVDGNLITGLSMGTAIPFALEIVKTLLGSKKEITIKKQLVII